MSVISTLKFIVNHPLNRSNKIQAIFRFAKWQILNMISKKTIVYEFTKNSKLIISRGMTGATGNYYCGLHEFYDMGFLLHFMRKEDLFVDIGANIGSYTILASAQVGCRTIAVEPVPTTFGCLKNNISLNNIEDKVTALNIALGSAPGKISFTSNLDTMNHVSNNNLENDIVVDVSKLDSILNDVFPSLIKLDVEGFESEVINGASQTLLNPTLKAIIIELNGSGTKFGFDDKDIHYKLLKMDFKPYTYDPFQRNLSQVESFGVENTIYIRDIDFVFDRVQSANKIKILNQEF